MADRRRPLWLAAQLAGALALAVIAAPSCGWTAAMGWFAAVLGVSGALVRASRRPAAGADRAPDADAVGGLCAGLLWAIALATLARAGGGTAAPLAYATAGCVAALAMILAAPRPIAGLMFLATGGLGAAIGVTARGDVVTGLATLLATLTALATLWINARTLLARLLAERALTARDGTISLLLREFHESADWLWHTDATRRLCDVTPALARQFDRPADAIEGRPLLALLAGEGWEHGEVDPGIRDLADRMLHLASFRDLAVPVVVGGERRWWSLSGTPRRDERGGLIGFSGVGTDVTDRHRSAERIDRMARFDGLTGLANRAHIIAALGDALRDAHHVGHRVTLMLVDLDRFKQVNDTLGHPIGDRLLGEVADRLRALAGPGDLCGRLGGDEFAVLARNADDRDRVEALAETIVVALSAPYEIEGHRLHIGASVGSATAPRDGRAVETILRNADLALYRAKDDGRGVHRRYEPELHAAAERRRVLEAALRAAIERGELRLVYQPIVTSETGELAAFEALLRWTHPELGPIAPDLFLPIAEEARLIGRIGDWVMHSACRDAASWPAHVRVSVNLAAAQLKDPQLPATIVAALSHSGLPADRLELEVGESVFLRGGEAIGGLVDRLLAIGVRIALAGFGAGTLTGFLRKGRFSSVKIDRAFVRGVAEDAPESVAIVRAIVALADSLGIASIAEGAETRADCVRMQRLGCAHIQGWTVGEPVDPDAARTLAERSEAARAVA